MILNLDDQARQIMRSNDRGGYTVPTARLYPYQWNWDSALAAYGFATFDLDRAWTELETLFSGQWDNGMVPHIIFHKPDEHYFPGPDVWGTDAVPPSSGISQPPVAATFARKLYERDAVLGRARLGGLYEKMLAWHRWFRLCRCESGAAAVTHPWEAGRDNAPDWDGPLRRIDVSGVKAYVRRDTSHVDADMRPTTYDYDRYIALVQFGRDVGWDETRIRDESPFRVADPTTTFTLLRANHDLKWLGETLGRATAEVDGWIKHLEQGAATLWNPELGAYDARDLRTGEYSGSLSNASFLCWYAGIHDERMVAKLDHIFAISKFAVPSYPPDAAAFDSKRYWRGPVWGVMNMLIGMGLEEAGLASHAERVRRDTARLIADNGFAEYYDPRDGTPAGGELAPVEDGSGEWAVTDRGEARYRAPLDEIRVSVLWKADVYRNEEERRRRMADTLSIPEVARVFDRDLEEKGADVRFDLDRIEDPGLIAEVSAVYPEAIPVGKAPSIFDPA